MIVTITIRKSRGIKMKFETIETVLEELESNPFKFAKEIDKPMYKLFNDLHRYNPNRTFLKTFKEYQLLRSLDTSKENCIKHYQYMLDLYQVKQER